jgi:hypothetical protein
MKHFLNFTLTLFSAALILQACDSKKSEAAEAPKAEMEVKATTTDALQDTIPNDTFSTWALRWQTNQKTWMQSNSINYFNMPKVDLTELVAQSGVDSTRFYIGLNAQNVIHLMAVGVDSRGNNMLDNSQGQFAYDVSKPCPTLCGSGGGINMSKK